MGKTKILKKQKGSSKNTLSSFEVDRKLLLDRNLVAKVLAESIMNNDIETLRDVLIAHLRSVSKLELSKQTGLSRQTFYDLMKDEKFDPRLSTLSAILSKIAS